MFIQITECIIVMRPSVDLSIAVYDLLHHIKFFTRQVPVIKCVSSLYGVNVFSLCIKQQLIKKQKTCLTHISLAFFLYYGTKANRIARDVTPQNAASHLGLFCLLT